jgi:hypothetical protein
LAVGRGGVEPEGLGNAGFAGASEAESFAARDGGDSAALGDEVLFDGAAEPFSFACRDCDAEALDDEVLVDPAAEAASFAGRSAGDAALAEEAPVDPAAGAVSFADREADEAVFDAEVLVASDGGALAAGLGDEAAAPPTAAFAVARDDAGNVAPAAVVGGVATDGALAGCEDAGTAAFEG